MTVLVVGEHPEIDDVLARRRVLGQDLFDDVWEGVYHMAPAPLPAHAYVARRLAIVLEPYAIASKLISVDPFNLGLDKNNYRVPDAGYLRDLPETTYVPTAVVVVEVLSPDDETYAKFDFYLARGVAEILVAHPTERWIKCYASNGEQYVEQTTSQVFAVSMAELVDQIRWL